MQVAQAEEFIFHTGLLLLFQTQSKKTHAQLPNYEVNAGLIKVTPKQPRRRGNRKRITTLKQNKRDIIRKFKSHLRKDILSS